MDKPSSAIEVMAFGPKHAAEWKRLLLGSNDGALFRDVDFLSHHPPEKFRIRRVGFGHGAKRLALLHAAGVIDPNGDKLLKPPYGPSVGGLVLLVRRSIPAWIVCFQTGCAVMAKRVWQGIQAQS
jgi:hypothetical protein